MDTPHERPTLRERAQLLYEATLRRRSDMLEHHERQMAQLQVLVEQQQQLQRELRAIAEHLAQRQDTLAQRQESHDELMRHLVQTLDAIKDLLERRTGQ